MGILDSLLGVVPFKKTPKAGGTANTPTFAPQQRDQILTLPGYQEHIEDLFDNRQADNAQVLMKRLFVQDPDVSSAVNTYLTLANTEMISWAVDAEGTIDPEASKLLYSIVQRLSTQVDYTLGFQYRQSLAQMTNDLRYMLLLRGGIGVELIMDKAGAPDSLRNVDLLSIRWYEKNPGEYKPSQVVSGRSDPVLLDQPNFFVAHYRRDPTTIYSNSFFVSVINTAAARQQVINDLYRIMRITGFPRMEVKVIEEILLKNAPVNIKTDAQKLKEWMTSRMGEIESAFQNIRADQSIFHTDAIEVGMLNSQKPGATLDISSVIETLNAQNQAALKTMATTLGRGASGVNTGSVEARLAAMFADELNEPLADLLSRLFSFCLHANGYPGFAKVFFRPAELRPQTELEPQMVLKANRLRQDLSDGIITDAEYTLEMYGRLPNSDAPPLSGTKFMTPAPTPVADPADVSPNDDSLGRSASGESNKTTKARTMTKGSQPKSG